MPSRKPAANVQLTAGQYEHLMRTLELAETALKDFADMDNRLFEASDEVRKEAMQFLGGDALQPLMGGIHFLASIKARQNGEPEPSERR